MASVVTYILIKILAKLICKGIWQLCQHVGKILQKTSASVFYVCCLVVIE